MSLVDSYGRDVDYLRISIADTCNLKCRYCSPPFSGRSHVHRAEILFYEELTTVAAVPCILQCSGASINLDLGPADFTADHYEKLI